MQADRLRVMHRLEGQIVLIFNLQHLHDTHRSVWRVVCRWWPNDKRMRVNPNFRPVTAHRADVNVNCKIRCPCGQNQVLLRVFSAFVGGSDGVVDARVEG